MTYFLRTFLNERIFVTPQCSLQFSEVKRDDEGVYSCYRRDLRRSNQWQTSAFVSIRLKIEESSIKYPSNEELIPGLLLLTLWSAILILLWIILSIWSLEINRVAIIQADERLRRKEIELKRALKNKTYCKYMSRVFILLTVGWNCLEILILNRQDNSMV